MASFVRDMEKEGRTEHKGSLERYKEERTLGLYKNKWQRKS